MKYACLILLAVWRLMALDLSPVGDPGGDCTRMDKGYYVICYDSRWKAPQWVAEHLTAEQLSVAVASRSDNFRPDPELVKGKRAELADYRRSGYDRGHMAPAGDFRFSQEAMSATFLLSNMGAQTPALNRGPWRDLEIAVRSLAAKHGEAWVFTGPVPSVVSKTIGRNKVWVPAQFYKVIACLHEDGWEAFGYILPNTAKPNPWQTYRLTVDVIEAITDLDFFSALPDQSDAETRLTPIPEFAPLDADAEQTQNIQKQGGKK